jgi:uracil phosphoribosyltransferase
MVNVLEREISILNQFIVEIRDVDIQKDSMRFRRNLERIGEIFALEISRKLNYKEKEVSTPLGIANSMVLADDIVLAVILRAGLPFHNGFLNYFDKADSSFITAYRKYRKDESFEIKIEYISSTNLDDKVLIICDPMLATGSSMVMAYNALLEYGTPKHVHIASIISSDESIEYLKKKLIGTNNTIWTGAIDDELTVKSYIVPGLGDAGDLAYGKKS